MTLSGLLCSAALHRRPPAAFGSHTCSIVGCQLHGAMLPSTFIQSTANGATFDIRQALSCTSSHVIYVITCIKCGVQGMGETATLVNRLACYVRAASAGGGTSTTGAIQEHFRATPHCSEDLRITLVDAIPTNKRFHRFLYVSLRLRLEHRWIHRLGATLNKRRHPFQVEVHVARPPRSLLSKIVLSLRDLSHFFFQILVDSGFGLFHQSSNILPPCFISLSIRSLHTLLCGLPFMPTDNLAHPSHPSV